VLFVAACAVVIWTADATAATQPPLSSVADSYVSASATGSNYGTSNQMRVDGSPVIRSYIRFTVPPPPGPVTKATLRVLTKSKTPAFQVRGTASTWTETSITYANAPAPSSTVTASSPAKASGVWVALDVTPLVTPLGATGGNVSFTLTTTSSTAMGFATREAGATSAPQLVLDTGTAGTPPANTAPPAIAGTLRDGGALTGAPGTWSGDTPMTFGYRWKRCAATCVDIAGATGQSYTLTAADVGQKVLLTVTATNSAGAATASSAQTGTVTGNPPVNISPPTITGIPEDGQTLTGSAGTWTGTAPIALAYQWQRCDVLTGVCSDIPGAIGQSYKLGPADVGSTIQLAVTGTNVAGSAGAVSAGTDAVAGIPPSNSSPPTVSGTPREGVTLSASSGTWTGSTPITFGYRWQRCNVLTGVCSDIPGATSAQYTAASDDVGATLAVVVTATNSTDSASAASTATAVVEEPPVAPSNVTQPSISGTARDGETLIGDRGTWSGTPPLDYSYQWRRCDDALTCSDIAGATNLDYTLTSGDAGKQVALEVTAANEAGTATSTSALTDTVAGVPPSNSSAPTISGSTVPGAALTADPGNWSGTTPITYAYQWSRCDATGANCTAVDGATDRTYALTSADLDATLRATVTADNIAGTDSATSTQTDVVKAPVDEQPTVPVRAAFYYPWFPENWAQLGIYPYTQYHPTLGFYDSSATAVIDEHIRALTYGGVQVGIASWWGQGTPTDTRLPLLLAATATAGSKLRWAAYYEPEGSGDPSVAQLTSDLTYLRDRYGSDPSYFRINGRFVLFVYGDGNDDCTSTSRWSQANATIHAYLVMKVFPGSQSCANQPDAWHQYAPANAVNAVAGQSYNISPGFYKAGESVPRLGRDLTRWYGNVRDMIASGTPFQLVTSFNEWGEGTSVESATEWSSASGYGAYLDALHADGRLPGPAPPAGLRATAGDGRVTLDWTAGTDPGLAGYRIYRRAADGSWPGTPTATATTSSWTEDGLTNGTPYTYRVTAYDTDGNESGPSASATATPESAADPVIAAAGDIACDTTQNPSATLCHQAGTSNLLVGANLAGVLTLGDNQ
jgi:hypothetical protein